MVDSMFRKYFSFQPRSNVALLVVCLVLERGDGPPSVSLYTFSTAEQFQLGGPSVASLLAINLHG